MKTYHGFERLSLCALCVGVIGLTAVATPTISLVGSPTPNAHVAINDVYTIWVSQTPTAGHTAVFNTCYVADGDDNGPTGSPPTWVSMGNKDCGGGVDVVCTKSWGVSPSSNGTRWHLGSGTDNNYFFGNFGVSGYYGWYKTP
jgi:hypothetical protein